MKAAASSATVRNAILDVSNRQIEQAAVAIVALTLEYPNSEEYGDKAGEVIKRCFSRIGLPDSEQELTPSQQKVDDELIEMIQDRAFKMKETLVRAGLLSESV